MVDASAYPGTSERAKQKSASFSYSHTQSVQPHTFPSRRNFPKVAKLQGVGERIWRGEMEIIPACPCSLFSKTQQVGLEGPATETQVSRDLGPRGALPRATLEGVLGLDVKPSLREGGCALHVGKPLNSKSVTKKIWKQNTPLSSWERNWFMEERNRRGRNLKGKQDVVSQAKEFSN